MFKEDLFSKSARKNLETDLSTAHAIVEATNNVYHKIDNPDGVLNLGVAVNKLQEDLVLQKDLDYGDPIGSSELRDNISKVINRHFNPYKDISLDDIVVVNGITSGLDKIASVLCDPGDAILIPTPCYSSFELDFYLQAKANVQFVPIPLHDFNSANQVSYYEKKLKELTQLNIKVKLIVICNPNNPLGVCYPKPALQEILKFADQNNIFVLFDEIYALSVYRNLPCSDPLLDYSQNNDLVSDVLVPFESVLSWCDLDSFIDPNLVIVAHGLSKDFCLNGFRVGWIICPWNKSFLTSISTIGEFSYIAGIADSIVCKFLADSTFLDSFITTMQTNLLTSFEKTTSYLTSKNVPFVPGMAGSFLWINIKHQLLIWKNNNLNPNESPVLDTNQLTFDDELAMWSDILQNGRIYITSGASFHSMEPGWARIIFAIPWETLKVGLDRLFDFMAKSHSSKSL
ncbi:putative inactive 1-aminocyclopropane-1-carboxylate synthase-like protein 2 [Smittium mucronatum]|uniref:Putative inactive 1-aminocyclopropane-1-carboxylate synthase-like protein 2 n=1 Tax=Smittium mucronatum TaxID=133383 RepID=A0A1R0H1I0_9FUNG|nr:putative inactive 1-aminocyclopropane-1-carboxylate synthase-like protein 2 [Smittium mucronatum]